ncbi:hypothetical protein NSQ59_27800 [Margalitia sp. FSL K6-0131]|uniref:hypothetical protein n=1 Tax=Margalitia sp. FSL K6-0131 TaxID=2954604 RepID=UPI0030F5E3B1
MKKVTKIITGVTFSLGILSASFYSFHNPSVTAASKSTTTKPVATKTVTAKSVDTKPVVTQKETTKAESKLNIESKFYAQSTNGDSQTGFVALVGELGKGRDQMPRYFEYDKDGYKGTLSIAQVFLTPDTQDEKDPNKQRWYSYYQGTITKVTETSK